MTILRPLQTVLVKPAGPDCNMACSYCFYLKKAELFKEHAIHRMRDDILEELIKQVMQQGGRQVTFGWQGGEPTLMGLPFFQKVVEFQQKYGRGQTVGNGLQTNGLLIGRKWVQLLDRYKFLVGLSLDGPKHVHDHYRHQSPTKGSWEKVVDTAHRLLDRGVATNALAVVTDYSSQHAEEIYTYLRDLGLVNMQFIPCLETDPNDPSKVADYSVSADAMGEFLKTTFDLWYRDFESGNRQISIRFFDSVFHSYVDRQAPDCHLQPECGTYTVIEYNGDVYSCDFFVEADWKLGNIMQGDLIDMLNSPRQRRFGKLKSDMPEECADCRWLKYCYGGCTKDRINNTADNGSNHFCLSMKMFFDHADERLTQLAARWKRDQRQ
ncbi:MAG TPA: anaerobic sulfatase maturase [Bacteroidetes bacterium]|nr:anaerobic sulfatase-maturating enzyme [bacterium BMS3Bbin04]HDO65889.1 anaerobic sulfatase maturase [Bacteroidota bacterium]HEX05014.1 anaerobic sulfatase maturase [Bacteroidota bacterium]